MLVDGVSEFICEDFELLDTPVDSLMPCQCLLHCPGVGLRDDVVGCTSAGVSSVSFVSNNLLTRSQHWLHTIPEDGDIIPAATLIGPINPNNVTSLNTYTNLVSNTSRPELVRVPTFVERVLVPFIDFAVNSIICDLAGLVAIGLEWSNLKAIIPDDLWQIVKGMGLIMKAVKQVDKRSDIHNRQLTTFFLHFMIALSVGHIQSLNVRLQTEAMEHRTSSVA